MPQLCSMKLFSATLGGVPKSKIALSGKLEISLINTKAL